MAKLPTAATLQRATPVNRGGIVDVPTSPVGAALQGLGQTVEKIGGQIQEREDQFDYAQAKTQFLVGKAQIEQEFKTDQDWTTFGARYEERIDKLQAETSGIIRSSRQREMFSLEAQTMAALGGVEIQNLARTREFDQGRATTIANLDAVEGVAFASPASFNQAVSTIDASISGAVQRGYYTQEQGTILRRERVEHLAKGWVTVYGAQHGAQAVVDILQRRLGTVAGSAPNLKAAILGQESGNRDNIGTSVDGAIGPGQIQPATFARYAKPGETITNPADNRAVSGRIIDDYLKRFGDPARAAVAYFSGEGNVAPAGSATPWKRDARDGNGKAVSSYVGDVLRRLGTSSSGVSPQVGSGIRNTGTPVDFIPLDDVAVLDHQYRNQADSALSTVRRDLAQQLQDGVAFVRAGGDINKVQPTLDRMPGVFDAATVAEARVALARAKSFADATREIATAPQTRVNEILSGAIPTDASDFQERAEYAKHLRAAADARNKAIQTDAAGYVAQNDPQANAALQDALAGKPGAWERAITTMDATFDRMQVPGIYRNVLPKRVALQIAGQIASGDGSAISANIDTLRSSMTARTWDRFYGDLVRVGKLDTVGQLAAEISPTNSRAKAAFGVIARLDPKAFNTLIPEKSDRDDIRDAVADALEDFRATVETPHTGAAGAEMYIARADAATRLAMQYYASGQITNMSVAAQVAANDLVNWAYDYGDGWRAPKAASGESRADDVTRYLETMQERFKAADIGFTEADRRLAGTVLGETTIRDHLFEAEKVWRNTRDDEGLQWFYAGTGEPVLGKNGKPVTVLFDKIPIGFADENPTTIEVIRQRYIR